VGRCLSLEQGLPSQPEDKVDQKHIEIEVKEIKHEESRKVKGYPCLPKHKSKKHRISKKNF